MINFQLSFFSFLKDLKLLLSLYENYQLLFELNCLNFSFIVFERECYFESLKLFYESLVYEDSRLDLLRHHQFKNHFIHE